MVNTWSNHSLINSQINGQHYFDGMKVIVGKLRIRDSSKENLVKVKDKSPGHRADGMNKVKYDSKKELGT